MVIIMDRISLEEFTKKYSPEMYNKIISGKPYFEGEILKLGLKFGNNCKICDIKDRFCLDKQRVKEARNKLNNTIKLLVESGELRHKLCNAVRDFDTEVGFGE